MKSLQEDVPAAEMGRLWVEQVGGGGAPGGGEKLLLDTLSLRCLFTSQRCQEGLWVYFECGKYFRTSINKYDF